MSKIEKITNNKIKHLTNMLNITHFLKIFEMYKYNDYFTNYLNGIKFLYNVIN
jgi:hypothetical protein